MIPTTILPLDSHLVTLENAGGKAANLARLLNAGFDVPGGFVVTTAAYRATLEANQLAPLIAAALAAEPGETPDALERASQAIRALFTPGRIPAPLAEQLRRAFAEMGAEAVAVRSSATLEDLPDLSFAGQQDTYLNIHGADLLLDAVARCWGSLWTARAIGYRRRNHLPQTDIALAVVVQRMVASEVSGVMFTANPLTGLRTETVIDATFGLGEALVSGQVEPDHYVVDMTTLRITQRMLGEKALAIRPSAVGGVAAVAENSANIQALDDAHILALARLGQQVQALYGFPQDIEWALADGQLKLLQSRPVTSLYPLPENATPDVLRIYFSFGAVQGMLEPLTPLARDTFKLLLAGGSHLLGYDYDQHSQKLLHNAGERLFSDVTSVVRNPNGRRIAVGVLSWVEPGTAETLPLVWDDPRLSPVGSGRPSLGTVLHLGRFFVPTLGRVLLNWASPEKRFITVNGNAERFVAQLRAHAAEISGSRSHKLAARAKLAEDMVEVFPNLGKSLVPLLASGMAAFNFLRMIAEHIPAADPAGIKSNHELVLEAMRGIAKNVTTQMDLRLWDTARAIRDDPPSRRAFVEQNTRQLAAAFAQKALPAAAQTALDAFIEQYGMRGAGEIDVGCRRWHEDPTPVIEVLRGYMDIPAEQAPDLVFARGAENAVRAVDLLAAAARRAKGGWIKARLLRFFAGRMRALIGIRESPKFMMIRYIGMLRAGLLESGREYVQASLLAREDDLLFLTIDEIRAIADQDARGALDPTWQATIDRRRATYEREKLRRQVPRLLLSDGRFFFEGVGSSANLSPDAIVGSPVSPGVVEGVVRVVLEPRGASLAPGEILVCPGTDPAWTPLFMSAGGLVMEVGGMMTHGAVVAREYGIPAVVGVRQATLRLQTGQRIRVNGSSGEIQVL